MMNRLMEFLASNEGGRWIVAFFGAAYIGAATSFFYVPVRAFYAGEATKVEIVDFEVKQAGSGIDLATSFISFRYARFKGYSDSVLMPKRYTDYKKGDLADVYIIQDLSPGIFFRTTGDNVVQFLWHSSPWVFLWTMSSILLVIAVGWRIRRGYIEILLPLALSFKQSRSEDIGDNIVLRAEDALEKALRTAVFLVAFAIVVALAVFAAKSAVVMESKGNIGIIFSLSLASFVCMSPLPERLITGVREWKDSLWSKLLADLIAIFLLCKIAWDLAAVAVSSDVSKQSLLRFLELLWEAAIG